MAYVFTHVPGSSVDCTQFIFEVEIRKELLYLRTDENVFFYLGLTYARKLPSLFIAFTYVLINPSFM